MGNEGLSSYEFRFFLFLNIGLEPAPYLETERICCKYQENRV